MISSFLFKRRGATLAGVFSLALGCVVLLCGAGSVPVENLLPQGAMQGDLNAGGHNLTNAATVSATNVVVSGSLTAPTSFTLPFSKLTSTPTTLGGYGITDPVVLTGGSYANPTWLTSLAYSKLSSAPSLGSLAGLSPTGTASSSTFLRGDDSWAAAGAGTVTSIAISVPSILNASGSPVTSSGTITLSLANQNANTILAGPSAGSAGAPTFRGLVSADIPDNAANTTGGAGSVALANITGAGTGVLTAAANAVNGAGGSLVLDSSSAIPVSTFASGDIQFNDGSGNINTSGGGQVATEYGGSIDTSIGGASLYTNAYGPNYVLAYDGYSYGGINANTLAVAGAAPASSSSTGITGQIAFDANYVYVCVATNTWARAALVTF